MNIIFDTETCGLFSKDAKYSDLKEFDKARLVSICWFIVKNDNIIEQAYHVIKPNEFEIPLKASKIHGITTEYAIQNGIDILEVLKHFSDSVKRCKNIIGHNIYYDFNIMRSELFRYNMLDELTELEKKHLICTMEKGRHFMSIEKFPKLSELYKYLYNEEITNAHNALSDVKHTYKCYIKMFPSDKTIFFNGDKEIHLTDEQKKIIFEDINKNILIIASAGSGKSTSIVTRIKYLIDNGIDEESIILTTFTRNAANDLKNKLFDIIGYQTNIITGTIDSIAKHYIVKNENEDIDDVSKYAPKYLEYIKNNPYILKKYKYLFIDEFQDINKVQFDIINEFYKNNIYIIGIGDSNQNIYSFRGSNNEYLLNFCKYFKNSITHKLTINFRSSQAIVDLANASIKNDIKMISFNQEDRGIKPFVKVFDTEKQQKQFILEKVKNLILQGYKEDDICIMCPINAPLISLSEFFTKNNINNYYFNKDNQVDKKIGCINLNTIHKSKGLEWPIVFLINMDDKQNQNIYNFNRENPNDTNDERYSKRKTIKYELEANRRLFYVGITRPKSLLYILAYNNNDNNYKNNSNDVGITRFIQKLSNNLYTEL